MTELQPGQPAERGELHILDKAYRRLVERAALDVPGTVAWSGVVPGQRYPKASVSVRRDRASVSLDVAAAWPAPLERLANEVRSTVRERARELGGLDIRNLDVTIHAVSPSKLPEVSRSRVQ